MLETRRLTNRHPIEVERTKRIWIKRRLRIGRFYREPIERGYRFRVREKITSGFHIPSSGHLRSLLGRKILELALLVLRFYSRGSSEPGAESGREKTELIFSRTLSRVLVRLPIALTRVGLLIVALTIGCDTPSKPTAEEQRADQLFVKGKLREAIRGYQTALKSGRTPRLLNRLGLANLLANEPEAAVKYLSEAKALAPKEVSTRRALAVALASSGRTEEARQEARDIIKSEPELGVGQVLLAALVEIPAQVEEARNTLLAYRENSSWWTASKLKAEIDLALADLYQRNHEEKAAQSILTRVREVKTINPVGAVELAVIYIRLHKLVPAERLLHKVVSSDPNYLPAWSRLAQVAVELKHFDLAQKALKELPSTIRNTDPVALVQARVYLEKDKAKAAIALLQDHLKNMPKAERNSDRAMVYRLFLAQGLSNSGDDAEARRVLLDIVSHPEVSTAARFALIEIDLRQKRYDEAESMLKQLISEPASAKRASDMLGKLYLDKRDTQAAIRLYTDRVEKDPKDARSMHHLGNAYQMAGKKGTAIGYYEKALEAAPGYEVSLRTLMTLAMMDDKPQLAEKYLLEQIKLRPKSAALQTIAGQFYMERGKKSKALNAFKAAVKLNRTDASAQIRLGRFYMAIDQPVVALSHFNEALRLQPDNVLALQHAAQTELTTGSRERAQKHYLRLLELQPENGAALNNLAYLFAASPATLDSAFDYATRARKIAPQSSHVADTLGWILYLKRSYEQALPLLKEAANKLPREAGVAFHLGMVQLATDREAQGLASLRKSLKLNSEFDNYNTAMLIVSMSRKRPELMKRYLSETFAASPQQSRIRAIEAEYFITQADFTMAEEALKAVLRIEKNDEASLIKLAQIYIRSNRAILALPLLRRAHQQQPDKLDILRPLSQLESEHGNREQAIKYHLLLLERNSEDIEALYRLATLYASSTKTLAEALKTAERAFALSPQDARIQDVLGWVMYQKKDYEKAIELLSKAARRLPEEAQVQYHLGMTQLALKQEAGARLLRKALALSARFEGADRAREKLREIEKQNAKATETKAQ